MQAKNIATGFCVECAIRYHYYKEILAQGEAEDYFPGASLPAAYIDGRRYKLQTPVREKGTTCGYCRRRVTSLYLPITE